MSEQRFDNVELGEKFVSFYDNDEFVTLNEDELCGLLNEQQDTIRKLQDLCGESDYENAKLRQKINKLKEENVKLREERQRLIYHLNKEPKR